VTTNPKETETMDDKTEYHFDATTLVGDLRDAMLVELKDCADGKPWNERPEVQQRALVDRIHSKARLMVAKAVLLISDKGFASLHGELVQVQVKDGFKAVVEIPRGSDYRHELVDAAGKEVVLVLATTEEFRGTRGAVPITPPAPLLDYAEEAARVADAAETPPEGWTPEPAPNEALGGTFGEDPPLISGDPTAAEEGPAAEDPDEGIVMDQPAIIESMQMVPVFHVQFCTDGQAVWHCWRDGDGKVRGHEHDDAARAIAARQKEAWDETAWETSEERQARQRREGLVGKKPGRKKGGDAAGAEASA
jgi:hypothetical protein